MNIPDVPESRNENYLGMILGQETAELPAEPQSRVEAYLAAIYAKGIGGGSIDGYYYNSKFYKDAAHTEEITPEAGKLYVDITTDSGGIYRWNGTHYVALGGGMADVPMDNKSYLRKNQAWEELGEFTPKHNLEITMIGNMGNVPEGNTTYVYIVTPLGKVLYDSFLYVEPTTITVPEGATCHVVGSVDAEGFINPTPQDVTVLEDEEVTITYKEFGTIETWDDIGELAYSGVAKRYMNVGDEMDVEYTDHSGNKYTLPYKVMKFDTITLQNGDTYDDVPLMMPFPYATRESMPFHDREALFANVTEADLPAGTYHFDIAETFDSWTQGKHYQFELTSPLPIGGQIRVTTWSAPEGCTIKTYQSGRTNVAIESTTLTEGTDGVSLGELRSTSRNEETGCNCMQRVRYGNGNYAEAYQRQWLTKLGKNGAFWSMQNPWDVIPTNVADFNGFMDGLSEEMLRNIPEVRVRTAYNTVGEPTSPNYYDTYDKFFMASVQEMYGSPQIADVEGSYFDYIKTATGLSAPSNDANAGRKHFAIENQTSAQLVRLRSAYRGGAIAAWICSTDGNLYTYYATGSYRCCPACYVIAIPKP